MSTCPPRPSAVKCGSVFFRTALTLLTVWLVIGCESYSLHKSIQNGDASSALRMIQSEGNVDVPDSLGNTPLLYAVRSGNQQVVEALLQKGANVNRSDGGKDFPLMAAARTGDAQIMDLLLKRGAKVNQTNPSGFTALNVASYLGHNTNIEQLLDAGADINACSRLAGPALVSALYSNLTLETVRLLIARGADINIVCGRSSTPLISAVFLGRSDAVDLFIHGKADLERKGAFGVTALIAAAVADHADICASLLHAGAQLEAQDDAGHTALVGAINTCHIEVAKLLVAAGAKYPGLTNSADQCYCFGVYRKLLADKQFTEGASADAKQNYVLALENLTMAQHGLQRRAKNYSDQAREDALWAGVVSAAWGANEDVLAARMEASRLGATEQAAFQSKVKLCEQLISEITQRTQHPERAQDRSP